MMNQLVKSKDKFDKKKSEVKQAQADLKEQVKKDSVRIVCP